MIRKNCLALAPWFTTLALVACSSSDTTGGSDTSAEQDAGSSTAQDSGPPVTTTDGGVVDPPTDAGHDAGPPTLALGLSFNGTPVTNAKLSAAGWAYSEEGKTVANIVRLTFTALGNTFDTELAIPTSTTANAPCFARTGGGGLFLSSVRQGGSCTATASTATPLGEGPDGLSFTITSTLSGATAPSTAEPESKMYVSLTKRPDSGDGNLSLATATLTGSVTIPKNVLSRMDATVSGAATTYTALHYSQYVGNGQYRPSILGVRPVVNGGEFQGYAFLQVLFVGGNVGVGGGCEVNGSTRMYRGFTDANQVPTSVEDSASDTAVNCTVTSTATANEVTGTFAGNTKGNDTTIITNGSYNVFGTPPAAVDVPGPAVPGGPK